MKPIIAYREFSHRVAQALMSTALILSSLFLSSNLVQARGTSIASKLADTQNSVTILILDMSGSMRTNDPQGYRCSAANAFIDLSGPGNFIGVVGLDGDGTRGGQHNFAQAQQWTPDPVDMSVQSNRDGLKNTIQQKSHNCAPDNITPTYDALNKALQMLENVSQSQEIPGSVVLLTDGQPDDGSPTRDVSAQINAIQSDLLPQFRQHKWPVDTVALGENGPIDESGTQFATFHDFLQGISNPTTGKFYDDSNGIVPGTTALNIAPFLTDIFARYNQRTVKDDITPTQLSGTTVARNFNVAPYTSHLDIVVVKDQDGTRPTLKDVNNKVIEPQPPDISIYTNAYYYIYSINRPQPGLWELDVQGTGQFLMKSLKMTTLNLQPLKVSQNGLISTETAQLFASGQELTIETALTNQGNLITDTTTYTLQGTISYNGAGGTFSQDFTLHGDASGTYTGIITVQADKPAGAYDIKVNASTGSLDNVLTSQTRTIRVGLFPLPQLISPQTGKTTSSSITTQAVQWDPILSFIYTLPLPSLLTQWALQGYPAGQATAKGQVTLRGQTYPGASISANTTRQGTNDTKQTVVQDDGGGNFHLQFPAPTSGLYTIQFQTSGTFADSHGDFGTTSSQVNVATIPSSPRQELLAWVITLIYLYILLSLLNLIRFFIQKPPFGGWQQNQDGSIAGSFAFDRAQRGPLQWFWNRDVLYSKQARLPAGLKFRFKHSGGIEVQPHGPAGANWQKGDGGRLQAKYQEARELRYLPRGADINDEETLGTSTYVIKSQLNSKTARADEYGYGYEDDPPYSSSSRSTNKKRGTSRTRKSGRYGKADTRTSYDDEDSI